VLELRPGLKDVRRPTALMHAYIVLSLLRGIRTEEARALRWAHVDLDGDPEARPPVPPHVAVSRSVRTHGETKTERSRRTLALPRLAGHASARTTEIVYRRELRPVITTGAEITEHDYPGIPPRPR
jgi:integrase